MFTGIITEIGKVKGLTVKGTSYTLRVKCDKTAADVNAGDSVAVNGVCLSVTGVKEGLVFDVVKNTLDKTNLRRLKPGDAVNLENALKFGGDISGHFVTGHIDGERRIKNSRKTSKGWAIDIEAMAGDEKYLVQRGSVSVDGVSLTVAEVYRGMFRIYLIPHTLENSTLGLKNAGNHVNIEFDMMAKYAAQARRGTSITEGMLREKGFI